MAANFRHAEIVEIARRDGKVTVDGLAARFDVTVQTIRRDLAELAGIGRLERVHGGAVAASGAVNIRHRERERLNAEGKAAIAVACARLVPDGASVFMGIGTTTEAVARELLDRADLLVVTNNVNIADILAAGRGCELVLTGGYLRHRDRGLVGAFAAGLVRQFKFDVAILGCSAIDADGDMLDFDAQEVAVVQTAVARARRVVVVADRSKLSRKAPVAIRPLRGIAALVTDAPLPPALAALVRAGGGEVVVAPVRPGRPPAP